MANQLTAAIWLGCLLGASAGENPTNHIAPTEQKLPDFAAARIGGTYSDGMDFDDADGSLSVSELDIFSLLSKPITVAGDILLIPAIKYELTSLDFDGVDDAFPIADEDLHSVSLHLAAIKLNEGSPWFYGVWARAELASDFQHINGDDFTFDVAAGAGYRVNESFTIAVGLTALNLNGDFSIFPGINFDWKVSEKTRVGLYGPMPVISYTPNDEWSFSLRGIPGGGIWNTTDDQGDSKSIDLSSYQVGAFASRKIVGELWLNMGAGVTLFNNITLADSDGDHEIVDEDMDSGLFGQIGLTLKTW
jgi:hypothetical protein